MHIHFARFLNRKDAGQQLAHILKPYANRDDVMVLALPRGGVPIGYEIAKVLKAPLDICLVRKLGVPGQEELALGAIAPRGTRVLNQEVISNQGISRETIDKVTADELKELQRRDRTYRGDKPYPNLHNKIVILVDDGIATGATMQAAIAILQKQEPAQIIVAVPIAAPQAYQVLKPVVDQVVCLLMPEVLYSIGLWYEDFMQTTDEDVCTLLQQATRSQPALAR